PLRGRCSEPPFPSWPRSAHCSTARWPRRSEAKRRPERDEAGVTWTLRVGVVEDPLDDDQGQDGKDADHDPECRAVHSTSDPPSAPLPTTPCRAGTWRRFTPNTSLTTLRPGVQGNLRKPHNLAAVGEKIRIPG